MIANRSRPIATCRSRERDLVADQRERDRHHAAGGHAGEDPRADQHIEAGRKAADERRRGHEHEAEQHQPRFVEHIGKRAEHRLHQA